MERLKIGQSLLSWNLQIKINKRVVKIILGMFLPILILNMLNSWSINKELVFIQILLIKAVICQDQEILLKNSKIKATMILQTKVLSTIEIQEERSQSIIDNHQFRVFILQVLLPTVHLLDTQIKTIESSNFQELVKRDQTYLR